MTALGRAIKREERLLEEQKKERIREHKERIKRNEETIYEPTQAGVKFDDDKVRMDLLPTDAMWAWAEILTFGAVKYSARNWELGMDWSRVYGGLMRHITAWWGGEDNDPETGKSHLAHAMCCISFLLAYHIRGVGNDDRPVSKPRGDA